MSTPQVPPIGLGWRLDELANAGRENLDSAHVARYDGKEDADAPGEMALLRGLVEFGCGTGQFTLEAAAVCDAVVAVDVSPVMLRALTAKLSERGATNVDVVQAEFLTYEHDGDPADFVYSRFALITCRLLGSGSPRSHPTDDPDRRGASPLGCRLQLRPGRH